MEISVKSKAIIRSIQYGHLSSAKSLIASGADIKNPELLVIGAENGHLDMVKLLIESGANCQNISMALKRSHANDHLDVSDFLIEYGVNPHILKNNIANICIVEQLVNTDQSIFSEIDFIAV